jgi:hypothetical protein
MSSLPSSGRPVLLLDIDGALSPLPHPDDMDFDRFVVTNARQWLRRGDMLFDTALPGYLDRLGAVYQRVWATSWSQLEINRWVAPVLGLPQDLPYIEFGTQSNKLRHIADWVGRHGPGLPVAWVDDRLGAAERRWAKKRQAPTLLVSTDKYEGIVASDVVRLLAFGTGAIVSVG